MRVRTGSLATINVVSVPFSDREGCDAYRGIDDWRPRWDRAGRCFLAFVPTLPLAAPRHQADEGTGAKHSAGSKHRYNGARPPHGSSFAQSGELLSLALSQPDSGLARAREVEGGDRPGQKPIHPSRWSLAYRRRCRGAAASGPSIGSRTTRTWRSSRDTASRMTR